MSLIFTTGMTMDQNMNAEAATNWAVARIAGSGAAPSSSLDASIYKEGAASMAAKIANINTDAVLIYDYYTDHANAVLNLNTLNRHILLWVLCTSVSAIRTLQNGGMYVLLQSSTEIGTAAPTKYAKFYIGGNDTYKGGWLAILIDPTKIPSIAAGGWVTSTDLAITRRIGVGIYTLGSIPTIKAENLYIDAIRYGKPLYTMKGDGSTVADWPDFLAHSESDANGLIQDLGGVYSLSCGVQIGDSAQSATTTFLTNINRQVIFKKHTYYYGGIIDVVDYLNVYVIQGDGALGYKTSITFGSVVGSGDSRQGILGGAILSPDITNITWRMNFQTNKTKLSAIKLYGLIMSGAKGGILLDNDSGATETDLISCQFINCGEIDPGITGNGATMLSCFLIDPLGGTLANRGLILYSSHNIKKINCITSGTPTTQHMIRLPSSGTYSVAFNAIIFYGDYLSGTLWHGEASTANATITLSLTAGSGSNPDVAEFEETAANITIDTGVSVNLKMIVKNEAGTPLSGVLVYIDDNDQTPFILNTTTDGSGEAQTTYTGSAVSNARWRARKYGYKNFKQLVNIGSDNISLPISLAIDPQQN